MVVGVVSRKCIAPKLFMGLIPYTVLLIVIGMGFGFMSIFTQWDDSINSLNRFCSTSSKHLEDKGLPLDICCQVDLIDGSKQCGAAYQSSIGGGGSSSSSAGDGSGHRRMLLASNMTTLADLSGPHCRCEDWWTRINVNILYDISPHVILYVFLPPLIFESAFFMDFHIFARSMCGILSLAILGVTVATFVTGGFLMGVLSQYQSNIDYAPLGNFDTAMMIGAILSATDPVAVVQLLKSLGASAKLGTLIEGESLLNDGTAYAMFLIFRARSAYHWVHLYMPQETCGEQAGAYQACDPKLRTANGSNPETWISTYEGQEIIVKVINLCILGPIIGLIVGHATMSIIEVIYNDKLVEVAMVSHFVRQTFFLIEI